MIHPTPPQRSASCMPGNLILYRESRSDLPLWPSVYLTDDATPQSFLETRPHGFFSIVLKLAPRIDTSLLRWAQISQMIPFDPSTADEHAKRSVPGLSDAYDVACEAENSGFDLDYWKAILASSQEQETMVVDSDNEDWSHDPEMFQAIQMSILDCGPQKTASRSNTPAACSNQATNRSRSATLRAESHAPDPYDSELPLLIRRPVQQIPRILPPAPSSLFKSSLYDDHPRLPKRLGLSSINADTKSPSSPQRRRLDEYIGSSTRVDPFSPFSQPSRNKSPTIYISDSDSSSPPRRKRPCAINETSSSSRRPQHSVGSSRKSATSGVTAEQVFRRNDLNTSASVAPHDDVLDEELDESSQFVQVFVGPEVDPASSSDIDPHRRKYKLQLMKNHVWDRPYFRDTLSARNYFEPIGDNTWELVHPRLADISPEDFTWAAEFLSDGDFGHREPEDEEQVAESFAQCISAWRTAELLSMDDLLEHIVEKMRGTQAWWDLWSVMAFACSIYQSEVPLQAHRELKTLFSEYIADLFFVYIEDHALSGAFLTRLKQLPELERDVLMKRVSQLEARPQLQQDDGLPQEEDDTKDLGLNS
ncbi:hypothetical protein OPT61_g6091 [Boeremia exigua]|uniref:Uncharacterized protein n=1 Tax=Boeremia exigua TaxID=749465 RepID=A0ACC2I803_9PLEO|nr:hypothetical protein OPT61_g6091 [Boeremia exigua]